MMLKKVFVVAMLLLLPCLALAQEGGPAPKMPAGDQQTLAPAEKYVNSLDQQGQQKFYQALEQYKAEVKAEVKAEQEKKETMQFAGFNWGLGLALTHTSKKSIVEAKVIDDVVRITKESGSAAGLMFETHYFYLPNKNFGSKTTAGNWGYGPFVALELTNVETKEYGAYAAGIMFGAKKTDSGSSWNIGFGYYVNPNVQSLGSGVEEGKPLPGTEKDVRFKKTDSSGWMIMLSSTF